MKKVVLCFCLLFAVLLGRAQVVLNEIYSNPNPNANPTRHEFFELYNTSTDPNPIQLDCYTLIVYYRKSASDRGFFVVDIPQSTIASKSFYVGASAININVQGSSATANFSWNSPGSTGYLKKYKMNGSTYQDVTSTDITANYNDIFQALQGGGDLAVFLFRNGVYINGLLGGFGSSTVPSQITGMPNLTVPIFSNAANNCGSSFTVNWSTITLAEFASPSGGTDNGFAREFDGNCGSWRKTSNQINHTPGAPNGSATGEDIAGLITTEKDICSRRIEFNITGTTGYATAATTLPVEVQLYLDNGTIGVLDAADEFRSKITVNSFTEGPHEFSIPDANEGQPYLLIYKTVLGCFDKVVVPPAATGSLTTGEGFVCGNAVINSKVTYNVMGGTDDAASYSLPITVELYYDYNEVGTFEPGVDILKQSATVSAFMTSSQSFTLPLEDRSQPVFLVYRTNATCFTKGPISFIPDCAPLPVHLTSFTAQRNGQNKQQVDLSWTTAQEQNNRGFYVQRKTEGEWKDVAFVFSAAEGGNSNTALIYAFRDVNTYRGVSHYRLLQADLDGKATFSEVRSVRGPEQAALVILYPNPAVNGSFRVLFPDAATTGRDVVVNDISGRLVQQYRNLTHNNLTITGLARGVYTIKITDRKTAVTTIEKIVVH